MVRLRVTMVGRNDVSLQEQIDRTNRALKEAERCLYELSQFEAHIDLVGNEPAAVTDDPSSASSSKGTASNA